MVVCIDSGIWLEINLGLIMVLLSVELTDWLLTMKFWLECLYKKY